MSDAVIAGLRHGDMGLNLRGRLYRLVMRIAHRYHWHYAPPLYPQHENGWDKMLWCQWCGFQAVIERHVGKAVVGGPYAAEPIGRKRA